MGYEIYKWIIYALLGILVVEQVIITIGKRKRNVYHLLLGSIIIINVCAFSVLMNAKNLEVAMEANRMTYIGGCLLPLVVLKIGASLCNLNIKMHWYILLAFFAFFTLGVAWSGGYSQLYYTDAWIEIVDGLTVLHKTYGPWHFIYFLYLGMYMIFALWIIINGIRNRKTYSNKMVLLYALIWGLVDSTYFIEQLLHNNARLMPIGLSIGMTLFVFWFRRVTLFDMSTSLINLEERERENGYVVFNKEEKIMTLNEKAVEFFPELATVSVDDSVEKLKGTSFYESVFIPLIRTEDKKEIPAVSIENGAVCAKAHKLTVVASLIHRGWTVELNDVSEEEKYRSMLRDYRERLEADVIEKTKDLDRIRQTIVMGMASMIESRDSSTGGHIRRTSDVVNVFAEELIAAGYPLSRRFLHRVVIAAPMHDLGKIAVDDAVLRKRGKYSPEEYEIMKTHAAKGAVIVRRVLSGVDDEELVSIAANVAHYHHEKWNGQGYPAGLRGAEIPVEARIMAIADVFDALVSKRYYKDAYSYDEAFKVIEESIGTHFDPELGKIFLETRPKLEELYNRFIIDRINDEETEVEE
ncbi:MAG: HD domain-containing protein [Lachnospiraceae bacterium]|nr:HD domain-containing protein [Lachnospiraceae bacterium]